MVSRVNGPSVLPLVAAAPEPDLAPGIVGFISQRRGRSRAPELPDARTALRAPMSHNRARGLHAVIQTGVSGDRRGVSGSADCAAASPRRAEDHHDHDSCQGNSAEPCHGFDPPPEGSWAGPKSHPSLNVPSGPKRSPRLKHGLWFSFPRVPGRSRALKAQSESRPSKGRSRVTWRLRNQSGAISSGRVKTLVLAQVRESGSAPVCRRHPDHVASAGDVSYPRACVRLRDVLNVLVRELLYGPRSHQPQTRPVMHEVSPPRTPA